MEKQDARLGMAVQYRQPLRRKYVPRERSSTGYARHEWQHDAYWKEARWEDGVIVGVRTVQDGDYDIGGWEEQAFLYNRTYKTAFLIAFDLRQKPVLVAPENVRAWQESF